MMTSAVLRIGDQNCEKIQTSDASQWNQSPVSTPTGMAWNGSFPLWSFVVDRIHIPG